MISKIKDIIKFNNLSEMLEVSMYNHLELNGIIRVGGLIFINKVESSSWTQQNKTSLQETCKSQFISAITNWSDLLLSNQGLKGARGFNLFTTLKCNS